MPAAQGYTRTLRPIPRDFSVGNGRTTASSYIDTPLIMAVFAINDRTEEFRQIVAAAQRRQATKPGKQRLLDTAQQHAASSDAQPRRSEFARGAAEIGRGISATMAKLEKLAQLAKKKTLFDDRPVEINEVS